MSYLALARKWRPRRFEDVMGQGHVVKALMHALDHDKLHPAILLTGTRGVGKTTLARIIAKGLNCEQGVSAHPCGVCAACREVDEGRSVDMLEIDAASNTGVDNVRELIDNAQYAPAGGRYKVYLIDEVHMLSKGAFNALLKTLEEPPPHVKFILATTDPQKLLVTVLSRCLQFNLKRLPAATIREQLALVLGNEGIAAEPGALNALARAADGSMRDGLSLLDQAIAFAGGGALQREAVEDMLGTAGRATLFEILAALARNDGDALLACIQRLDAQAPDYAALLNDFAAILQRLSVLQLLPKAQNEDDEEALLALREQIAAEDVQLYYQIAVLGRRDLPYAPDPRLGFEMTLLRMLAFRPDEGGGTPQRATPPAGTRPAPASGPVSASAVAARPAPAAAGVSVAPAVAPMQSLPLDASWDQRVEAMPLEGLAKQLARNCAWTARDGDAVRLSLDLRARHLLNEERRAALERGLAAQLGEPVRVIVDLAADEAIASPAQLDQQRASDRQRAAEAAIEADPAVRAFKDLFGASVKPGSVRPLDS
ncbi:MAG: DNA polymerase III subunit gamma/tau [Nevskiaceae bacterium]|nr:MAG: DNA polymerase III subunit gamma/tau [Nevskiaceae bacterium]